MIKNNHFKVHKYFHQGSPSPVRCDELERKPGEPPISHSSKPVFAQSASVTLDIDPLHGSTIDKPWTAIPRQLLYGCFFFYSPGETAQAIGTKAGTKVKL